MMVTRSTELGKACIAQSHETGRDVSSCTHLTMWITPDPRERMREA